MRKACIYVVALLMMLGQLALVHPEKRMAQAQQQPATETKRSVTQSNDFPSGRHPFSGMRTVPPGNLS